MIPSKFIVCIFIVHFHSLFALGEDATVRDKSHGSHHPHRPIFRDGYPSNTTAPVGGRAEFECQILFDPTLDIVWLKHLVINGSYSDSADLPYVQRLNATDPRHLVLDPVRPDDEGFYTCLASNAIGVSYRSAYLQVVAELPPREEKAALVAADDVSVVAAGVLVFVSIAGVALAIFVWRTRCVRSKVAFEVEAPRVILKKTVVLVEREDSTSLIPFIKIDYTPSSNLSQTSNVDEYELPLDPDIEFPRDQLVLGPVVGEGAFARVVRAEAKGPSGPAKVVAVKMLREDHTDADMLALFSEIQLMKNIGKHVNVVSFLGCCTQGGPLYAIMEFAEQGNLRDHLRLHRIPLVPQDSEGYEVPLRPPTDLPFSTLVNYALQAAKGMRYLASRGCIHRDLAARNVLLTAEGVVKIGDFGLSRELQESEYYRKSTHGKLPVKWMAPEALCERVYSTQSDVWSFGVLLYEIFTLGATPYPTVAYEELFTKLKNGHRMDRPDNCPEKMYKLMRHCWEYVPKDRPSFEEIVVMLEENLLESSKLNYLRFDFPTISTPENSSSEDEE